MNNLNNVRHEKQKLLSAISRNHYGLVYVFHSVECEGITNEG